MNDDAGDLIASGDNYTLHLRAGVAVLRVWMQRDMSSARGAELAQQKRVHIAQLARRSDVRALVFDLVDASPAVGPVTQQAVREMLDEFVRRRHPVVVLVGPSAMQTLQFERLVRAATKGRESLGLVTADRAAALAFVRLPAP